MKQNDYVSIVILTMRLKNRTEIANKCIKAILDNTSYPYELILIDNSQNNRGLTDGRNLGISMATGKYLCIMDDDILVSPGWMETCIGILKETDEDKYLVTPVHQIRVKRYERPMVGKYRQNERTGSNCMIGKREIFDKVGLFPDCKRRGDLGYEAAKVGKVYATRLINAGYSFLVTKEAYAEDLGRNKHAYYDKDFIR